MNQTQESPSPNEMHTRISKIDNSTDPNPLPSQTTSVDSGSQISPDTNPIPTKAAIGDSVEISIRKLAWGGEGLGSVDGAVVFVPELLPGESARVEITSVARNYYKAACRQLLSRTPERRTPPCAHVLLCGGCQIQHAYYTAQVRYKQEMLKDIFTPLMKRQPFELLSIHPSPLEFGYRLRARWKCQRLHGRYQIGYFQRKSHTLVDITSCALLEPELNRILEPLKSILLREDMLVQEIEIAHDKDTNRVVLDFYLHQPTKVTAEQLFQTMLDKGVPVKGLTICVGNRISVAGANSYTIHLNNYSFRITSGDFTQVNRRMMQTMIDTAVDLIHPMPCDSMLDLYCGSGFFSIPIASHVLEINGVELSSQAISNARFNAHTNSIKNASFAAQPVEHYLKTKPRAFDAAIIDPPRGGCDKSVLRYLCQSGIPRILFISCEPVIMARDLKRFAEHGYLLKSIQPLDLFPQTYHIECMAMLTLANEMQG